MNFEDIEEGGVVYYAEIKDTELIDGVIKSKKVVEVRNFYATNCREIHFEDSTIIMPRNDVSFHIKYPSGYENVRRPLNFTIYASDYNSCLLVLKDIISTKFTEINKEYKNINIQISKVCLLNSKIRDIGKNVEEKNEVHLETVYAD